MFFFGGRSKRSTSYQQVWGAGGEWDSSTGGPVTALSALHLAAVYAATSLIADSLASAPWAAFEKSAEIPVRLTPQPALVTDPGVDLLDVYSWKHQLVSSLLLWGNAYGLILAVDSRGIPSKVQWLRPDQVTIDEQGTHPVFAFNSQPLERSALIHVPWYTVAGSVKGLSPVGLFCTQIETGHEAQRVGRNFFRRGTVPSAILKNDEKTLDKEEAQNAKEQFKSSVSNAEPFVTGKDWSYQAIGLPANDAAFLAGIKATATQIAAIYRVAPEQVGGEVSVTSLTYKSLEQDQIKFNTTTLRPIASRIEAVVDRYLPPTQYAKFNLDASVRADLKTRYEAHALAIASGWKTPDEVRQLEELPPLTPAQVAQIKALQKSTPTPIDPTP